MNKCIRCLSLCVVLFPVLVLAADAPPLATLTSFSGAVSVGQKDAEAWGIVTEGMALNDRQVIRTGADGRAVVTFTEGSLSAVVAEKTTISLADLLLKTRLGAMRSKVTAPEVAAGQTKLTVTPLTGVRGTDQGESKADDPGRQHHWEENAPATGQ